MYKFLVLPLFFAAVSAGYLGSSTGVIHGLSYGTPSYGYAGHRYGYSAHAAPTLVNGYSAPVISVASHPAIAAPATGFSHGLDPYHGLGYGHHLSTHH